ncbi:50S ribosomal protein L25/general stress protein Ctc [Halobacillus litoralis]|uniref:Large ribosomal subunit protein bL25 n=1 Tax=Halobacillus litoralis TaxID=45668 RepID=A0A845DYT1_9BACI|nr:50S ribosomal protein L25/general stress protein Ctc [Halobacillus litoralis]MCA1024414.1 50S ribosomal protein L25/general stress protein Ctc [Halobacillus litoralis]MYL21969.1 50S ribosomal protein L25/general stress protein Ctc [Halobacillus litoralis]MYL39769.1 50S ribosomal protein L25/general stress protein Ctc [Halobacillus litoralis]
MAITLKAKQRQNLKQSVTRELRQEGDIPSVVYGNDKEPITVAVNSIELLKTVRDEGKNAIISLNIEGKDTVDVMLHDYQVDPLKDELIHADFYVVNMSQEMDVEVPVRLEGEAAGSKEGGVVQQPLYDLAVRAKPADIPEEILVDISELNIGDSVMVSDLKASRNYEITEDDNTTIVSVTPPEEMPEEEPEPLEVDADPEASEEKFEDEKAGTDEAKQ